MQVLKKDWPARWPSFIPELVGASKTSENLCENSMHILKLLSEEVFDFNRGELTQAKTRVLKAQLNHEFEKIHELCHFVLRSTDLWTSRPALIKATLAALHVCSRRDGHSCIYGSVCGVNAVGTIFIIDVASCSAWHLGHVTHIAGGCVCCC